MSGFEKFGCPTVKVGGWSFFVPATEAAIIRVAAVFGKQSHAAQGRIDGCRAALLRGSTVRLTAHGEKALPIVGASRRFP